MTVDTARDLETRDRLLDAATRLFAESGFNRVTVRDICERAHANVAAINYHFGGKVGLYEQVLQAAIRIMQASTDEIREAGAGKPPEEQLRAYVRIFITRVVTGVGDNWIHQLMMREMSDPTPSLDLVAERVIRPRIAYLAGVIAQIMGTTPDNPRVIPCAFSVNAQCVTMLNHKGAARINPAFAMTPASIEAMADHIMTFSLAGIRAVAQAGRS